MAEPVTLPEAKLHLRVTSNDEDALISGMIVAAREWVEGYTGQIIAQREVVQSFDGFGPYLDLRSWPIVSVDSVTYADATGTPQTLDPSGYTSFYGARPARITASGSWWPGTATRPGAVSVAVTAGYAADAVPFVLKQAMLVLISGYYENRSGLPEEVERAARSICAQHRIWGV